MIDTAQERRSAVATRRLPWFRRFLPAPDASMTIEDRRQLAFVYVATMEPSVSMGHVAISSHALYNIAISSHAVTELSVSSHLVTEIEVSSTGDP